MRLALVGLIICVCAAPARAWLRPRYEDADVVARSELIVVGAIKVGSIQYVPNPVDPGGGHSWEHHATLLVHEVIKGTCTQKGIPIIIHYGLEPLIDGHSKHDGFEMNLPAAPGKAGPEIDIADEGNSEESFEAVLRDAQKDNLWFLRRRTGEYGEKPGTGDYGIVDPEDVEPMALKPYFECYLTKDPEAGIRAQLQIQPAIAGRATRYLEHLAVKRILAEPNAAIRVERLLPYYGSRQEWGYSGEARAGIVSAGAVAGPYLMGVYAMTWDSSARQDIIRLWGDIRYAGCVDTLIDLLKTNDRFWAAQKLQPGWWNKDVDSLRTRYLRDRYGEVYSSVCALEQIGDPRATEALELTRKRWAAIQFDNPQIVDECDKALASH